MKSWQTRKVYDIKIRLNKTEKDLFQKTCEAGGYENQSQMVRALVRKEFGRLAREDRI